MRARILASIIIVLAGCSEAPSSREYAGARTESADQANVSPAQARAARLLSVTGAGSQPRKNDYDNSVICAGSLAVLVSTLSSSPLLGQAEANVLKQAQRVYRIRAFRLAPGKGKTSVEARSDIEGASNAATDDMSAASRVAIDCIGQLANDPTARPGAV